MLDRLKQVGFQVLDTLSGSQLRPYFRKGLLHNILRIVRRGDIAQREEAQGLIPTFKPPLLPLLSYTLLIRTETDDLTHLVQGLRRTLTRLRRSLTCHFLHILRISGNIEDTLTDWRTKGVDINS